MNKRIKRIYVSLLLVLFFTAPSLSFGRAFYLCVLEILSVSGCALAAGCFIAALYKKGFLFVFKGAVLYLLVFFVLWFSCAVYVPFEIDRTASRDGLIALSNKLHADAVSNYSEPEGKKKILTEASRIMETGFKAPGISFFPFDGFMDNVNLSGIYLPFTGHSFVNPKEHDFLIPFVSVHELSHRHGYLDEGQANIYAYLKCMESGKSEFIYSASVYALKNTLRLLKKTDEAAYTALVTKFDEKVLKDLSKMAVPNETGKSPFSNYQDITYGLLKIYAIP